VRHEEPGFNLVECQHDAFPSPFTGRCGSRSLRDPAGEIGASNPGNLQLGRTPTRTRSEQRAPRIGEVPGNLTSNRL
jgi:hypothetical protein